MHIYFSAIGGTGIGPLALIAKQAGYEVSGSDQRDSKYIEYLRAKGITDIHIGQSAEEIIKVHKKNPIDWFVRSSAVSDDHPEMKVVRTLGIKNSKRDELLNKIITEKNLKLIAVAGTHGKSTTTAMIIWLFKQLGMPVSYSVGGKISYGDMGEFDKKSEFFVYEADEFDRNFLAFQPFVSVITGIAWDHPDIYQTREEYYQAFRQYISQSQTTYIWDDDALRLGLEQSSSKLGIIHKTDYPQYSLIGKVNRENAALASQAVMKALDKDDITELVRIVDQFPGLSRRFEKIAKNVYSDYAHTPEKIKGALQLTEEVNPKNTVVVYEGLHNTRQHFIKDQLPTLFSGIKKLYIVPSYRAREDETLEDLTPDKLKSIMTEPQDIETAELNDSLRSKIHTHANNNELVLCLSAGGGRSLDEWVRKEFKK